MAQRIVTDCDYCGSKNVPVKEFAVAVGWDLDPAGGSGSHDYETFDLCLSCAVQTLNSLIDGFHDYEISKRWLAKWKMGRKRNG